MPAKPCEISVQPHGITLQATRGSRLVDVLTAAGIVLDLPCGGEGVCGKCRVILTDGAPPLSSTEEAVLDAEAKARGERLACQIVVDRSLTIEIPAGSLQTVSHQILTSCSLGQGEVDLSDRPIAPRLVEIGSPDRSEALADLKRLEDVLGPVEPEVGALRALPEAVRAADGRVTAVLSGKRLLDIRAGHTNAGCFALAVDLGTTTLVVSLLDTCSRAKPLVSARLNPQTQFGDDVISRIQYARENADGVARLHGKLVAAINESIETLCHEAGIAPEQIYHACFAGNTTMQHLLCGLNPRYLGESPFTPAVSRGLTLPASDIGIRIHPHAQAYVFPCMGGFVGGDIVAGVLATDMLDEPGVSVLADIGTNGEIVLHTGDRLVTAATAAGPAFEGARIRFGMRAADGAVERFWTEDGRWHYQVIGGQKPRGICGSALIDAAAELLELGVLHPDGRMCGPDEVSKDWPSDIRNRVTQLENQRAFVLVPAAETADGRDIVLTQRDVRQLQLASGAIRAGIVTLLEYAGIRPEQLCSVYLAGGFGNYIRRRNAQRIGLLPSNVPRDRIRYCGNTSLAGAMLAAFSLQVRKRAEEIARQAMHVDLSTIADFRWAFAEAMIFPEPSAETPDSADVGD
ncbi:ASKHA domain-containing protein [Thermostilla marina]